MGELKQLREEKGLTQRQVASFAGVSLRSYITYENDPAKELTPKYCYLLGELQKMRVLDEEHGLLTIERIKRASAPMFEEYLVDYAYLYGSYARGLATSKSNVNLLVSGDLQGLQLIEVEQCLREALHKKVTLLDVARIVGNEPLIDEVLRSGVKIFG